MKTELEVFHMIGRLKNTHPQPGIEQGQIDATITALGWVLGSRNRVCDRHLGMVYELTVDTYEN